MSMEHIHYIHTYRLLVHTLWTKNWTQCLEQLLTNRLHEQQNRYWSQYFQTLEIERETEFLSRQSPHSPIELSNRQAGTHTCTQKHKRDKRSFASILSLHKMGIQTLLIDSRFFLYSCVCHCSSSAHKQCPCSYALTHKLPSSFSQLCYSCWSCSSTTHHPSTHIRCYYPTSATNFHNPFLASSSSSSSSPLSPPHTTKNRIPREKINSTLLSVQFQKHTKPKTAPPKK